MSSELVFGRGHNSPPDMAETVADVAADLNAWMMEHPVIQTEEDARSAKPLIDRAKLAVADLESERKTKVGPLNEQVKAINEHYRSPRETLERITEEICDRLSRYMEAEELRRRQIAEAARQVAEEAEIRAREAEAKERDALADAEAGELDIDVLTLTNDANAQFAAFQRSQLAAARAERDSRVRIGGGLTGRALGLRTHETLIVADWQKAIEAIGLTTDIQAAICKVARAWRKLHGELPPGVEAEVERKL